MGALLNDAVNRISLINFEDGGNKFCESHHILISEYFRRVNAVLNTLSLNIDKYPIFRIASVLGNSQHVDIMKVCPMLKDINNLYIKAICYYYLEICSLVDERVDKANEYADLYEPMIKLLERGGSFNLRQGELLIGTSAYPLSYWRELNITKQDISEANLERVDRETN
ncbi:hypothetical protein QW71_35955 [Paenibacillus sp. IHB B 3415]|uniref:hypothetical protein n=1 Tax=Paenibacillus sp. IHB B 3415 TaxID=867080 RepID=UPI000573487F|nr:hypothetical protein [Paenibacillus sp. IHB B 3415]KHL91216.1 hypothetical protein QW71_35955 [Paenibacillus sp. IHB B 3415]